MKVFVVLRTKAYSFLINDGSEDKKAKGKNKICHEGKLKCEDYKKILETNQLENELNHLKKIKVNWRVLKKDHKEFIKSNKLISKR